MPPLLFLSGTFIQQALAAAVQPSPLSGFLTIAALAVVFICLYAISRALPPLMAPMQTPLLKIARTVPGTRLLRVKGRLRCADPLRSRIDGLHCLYAGITVWEEIHHERDRLELVKIGDFGAAWALDPAIEDDTGRLPLRFEEPRIDFALKRKFYAEETVSSELDQAFTEFITAGAPVDTILYRPSRNFFQETYLPCDVPVTLWGYRVHGDTAPDGAAGDALVVTRVSHASDLRAVAKPLAQVLICGTAMISLGLAFARYLL